MARQKTLNDDQKKTARVSLLMTPAMFADVNALAQMAGTSVNGLFLSLAAELIKKNRQAIDEVQAVITKVSPFVQTSLFDDDVQ